MAKKIFFFLSVLIGILLVSWYTTNIKPIPQLKNLQIFVIPKGQSTRTILKRLQAEGIIKSAPAAEIYLFLTKQRGLFQAGSFKLNPSMPISEISQVLKTGTLDVWITIPEGWRAEQIVDELKEQGLLKDSNPDELYKLFQQSEGRLFPDTYLLAKDSSPEQIISRMVETFAQKTNSLIDNQSGGAGSRSTGQPITNNDVILASLVEREAKHDADRPLVASVFKNRLKIGMALQVDATLQYPKATPQDWWPTVYSNDKNINSPYNTYKFPGLPPGPIANPGIEAIKAVLNPTETDYLYYISEPDGTTHFAKNLEEHNANIRRYLMR